MSLSDLETKRKRLQRLRVLQALNLNRPDPLGDGLIKSLLKDDVDLAFTQGNIRNSIDYLEMRQFVKILSRRDDVWTVCITADGVDYLDGLGEDVEGVARPSEF